MTARNILQTAVADGCIVQGHPACQMGHWRRPGPIAEVLMKAKPRGALAAGRFAEDLVMQETHRPAQQLVGGEAQPRRPAEVVEGQGDAPGARRHEGVEGVPEALPGVPRHQQRPDLGRERVALVLRKHRYSGQVAPLLELLELLPAEGPALPGLRPARAAGRAWATQPREVRPVARPQPRPSQATAGLQLPKQSPRTRGPHGAAGEARRTGTRAA
mmetsp:Transcript_30458/g.87426  ORF Transcript_30458/g.87426 Transcript_30458/m.87426 type:complete len:216 (+) Transcript_30458:469-1116(+)